MVTFRINYLPKSKQIELGKLVEQGKIALQRLDEEAGAPNQELLRQQVQSGEKARDILIRTNQRFIYSVAQQYGNPDIPIWDRMQDGNAGAVLALDHYDWRKECTFVTYAFYKIRVAIKRAAPKQNPQVPFNTMHRINLKEIQEQETKLRENGEAVTLEKLAQLTGHRQSTIETALRIRQSHLSLEASLREDDERSISDTVGDVRAENPEDVLVQEQLREAVKNCLTSGIISPRQTDIIGRRFGFYVSEPQTLEEIGMRHGIGRDECVN